MFTCLNTHSGGRVPTHTNTHTHTRKLDRQERKEDKNKHAYKLTQESNKCKPEKKPIHFNPSLKLTRSPSDPGDEVSYNNLIHGDPHTTFTQLKPTHNRRVFCSNRLNVFVVKTQSIPSIPAPVALFPSGRLTLALHSESNGPLLPAPCFEGRESRANS